MHQANVELSGADSSYLTITNLTGALLPPAVALLPATDGNQAEYLFCHPNTSSSREAGEPWTLNPQPNP